MSLAIWDGLVLLTSILGIGGLLGVGAWLRRGGWSAAGTRRVVHAGVGLFVAGAPLLFSGPVPLCLLAAGFVGLNATARARGWWPSVHAARPESWGTVALPLAVLPAVAATWAVSPERIVAFQASFLVVALADPLAAWLGDRSGRSPVIGTATWEGTAAFTAATTALVGGVLFLAGETPGQIVLVAICTGATAAAVEAISRDGWDNLFVVLAVTVVLVSALEGMNPLQAISVGLVAGLGFGAAALGTGGLTTDGAVGGGLFAASLVALGGVEWVLPGIIFFALSSALSMLPSSNRDDQGTARSLRQVLANGGVAWGLLLIYALAPVDVSGLREAAYIGFLGALAAAAADTWATELGTRYGGKPRFLFGREKVPTGTSGAVSLVGTGAGILGAGTVAAAAVATGAKGGESVGTVLTIIPTAGLAGMMVDSVAGATLEAVPGSSPLHTTVEIQNEKWRRLDNEGVNLLCTTAGALIALALWAL